MKNYFNNDVQCNGIHPQILIQNIVHNIIKLKRQTEEQYVQYACLYKEDIGNYICKKRL